MCEKNDNLFWGNGGTKVGVRFSSDLTDKLLSDPQGNVLQVFSWFKSTFPMFASMFYDVRLLIKWIRNDNLRLNPIPIQNDTLLQYNLIRKNFTRTRVRHNHVTGLRKTVTFAEMCHKYLSVSLRFLKPVCFVFHIPISFTVKYVPSFTL